MEVVVLKTDKLYLARYNDYYGALLTEKQSEMIKLYYDCDISLFEIAEQFGVSRQAVRDSIIRAEQALEHYENVLGLYRKQKSIEEQLDSIQSKLNEQELGLIRAELDSLRRVMEEDNGDI